MTAQSFGTGNSGWTVTSQIEATDIDATGRFVPGYRVYFTTGNRHSGSVFVPKPQYTVETVRNLINTHADELDAVGNLSSAG